MRVLRSGVAGIGCALLLASGVRAQGTVPEPISAAWPLADIAFDPEPLGQLQLIAIPSPITLQSGTPESFLYLDLDPDVARAWLPLARRFVDSVLKAPRDINGVAAGLSLPTNHGAGRVTLAHQPNHPPTSRFLLVLSPPAPDQGWTVQGSAMEARRFLAALDSATTLTLAGVAPDAVREAARCHAGGGTEALNRPRMSLPTQKRTGGRALLEFVVDRNGQVVEGTIRALLSSGKEYTREAVRTLKDMRFAPGECDGQPASVLVQQGFSWQMRLR